MAEVNQLELLKKGAEASLYFALWHGRKAVLKRRLPKKYRPRKMDRQIRTYRTVHESQLMHEAKMAGVPTPSIFSVNVKEATIVMEYVEGNQIKQHLGHVSSHERHRLCLRIGELIGRLHKHGIIHGDLTTSNMILNQDDRIFFVDFGLGEKSAELEARGVDLHLAKRALESAHFQFADECFAAVVEGYGSVLKDGTLQDVLEKVKEIERRGRYVSERKERI
jgi:TP53 regulating kinase-like protein